MGALFYPDVDFEKLKIPEILREVYLDGVYNDILAGNDMVILDVGANIGLVTQHMRKFARKVYAIEPSPLEFEALKQNKLHNHWDNVELFNCAIADRDGQMDLSINGTNHTGNTLILKDKLPDGRWLSVDGKYIVSTVDTFDEKILVQTRRLDTFLTDNQIGTVDFMKLDVEGAEGMILTGEGFTSIADRIKAIEIEFHYKDWGLLSKHLLSLGYQGMKYPTAANVVLYTR